MKYLWVALFISAPSFKAVGAEITDYQKEVTEYCKEHRETCENMVYSVLEPVGISEDWINKGFDEWLGKDTANVSGISGGPAAEILKQYCKKNREVCKKIIMVLADKIGIPESLVDKALDLWLGEDSNYDGNAKAYCKENHETCKKILMSTFGLAIPEKYIDEGLDKWLGVIN